jgi:DNA (cytosine-5)-methyltransferase 1
MMPRFRALDLFAGAGGAAMGLYRAGFDVTGVDIVPQPRFPAFHKADYAEHFRFIQADALTFLLAGYDFIWASPPCQAFTTMKNMWNARSDHPNLIPEMRCRLLSTGLPFCIENVDGAPLGATGNLIYLCGTMFGLRTPDGQHELRRHRLFETNFNIPLRPACHHNGAVIGVYGGHGRDRRRTCTVLSKAGGGHKGQPSLPLQSRREAMGIDWMRDFELSQSIPPAYSEFIGRQVIQVLNAAGG